MPKIRTENHGVLEAINLETEYLCRFFLKQHSFRFQHQFSAKKTKSVVASCSIPSILL